MRTPSRKHEGGAALLIAMLILAFMGVIGLASLDTVTRDRQVAGFQSRAQTALYAAEAGVAFGIGLIRRDAQSLASGGEAALHAYNPSSTTPGPAEFPNSAAPQTLGAADFPAPGPPRFYMDPNASDPNDTSAPARAIGRIGNDHDAFVRIRRRAPRRSGAPRAAWPQAAAPIPPREQHGD